MSLSGLFRDRDSKRTRLGKFDHDQWWPNLACAASPRRRRLARARCIVPGGANMSIDERRDRSSRRRGGANAGSDQSRTDAPPSEVMIPGGSASWAPRTSSKYHRPDRPMETLQIQVADVRDLYRSLDGAERPLAIKICPGRASSHRRDARFVTPADRRVLAAMFKSDLTQCGIASRYTDSESESVALSAPVL
jgi:hypothetical protein